MSSEAIVQNYFEDALSALRAYKKLAEKAIAQLQDEEFFVTIDEVDVLPHPLIHELS